MRSQGHQALSDLGCLELSLGQVNTRGEQQIGARALPHVDLRSMAVARHGSACCHGQRLCPMRPLRDRPQPLEGNLVLTALDRQPSSCATKPGDE